MGYNTRYTLRVDGPWKEVLEYIEADPTLQHPLGDMYTLGDGRFDVGEWTWYDHEQDMKFLSTDFPDILFTLEGKGEDRDDLWVKYFKAGKIQRVEAKIEYDPFDPEKLVDDW